MGWHDPPHRRKGPVARCRLSGRQGRQARPNSLKLPNVDAWARARARAPGLWQRSSRAAPGRQRLAAMPQPMAQASPGATVLISGRGLLEVRA